MDFLAPEECTEVLHTHFESVGAPKDRSMAKALSHDFLFPPGNIVYHQGLCFEVVSLALLQLVGPKYFFADFRFTDIKIDTRGFSGTVIPNLATVLLYEACARHFYQDVVKIYQDYFFRIFSEIIIHKS